MEECQSLKVLSLNRIEMDEDQIRALGAISRPDLEIKLMYCQIPGASAEALAEVLGRNQGPTEIWYCDIDNLILARGLRGNSRLKNFRTLNTLCLSSTNEVGSQEILAIAGALRENKGLVNLAIRLDLTMSDRAWGAICDSLKTLTHPTLQVFNFESMYSDGVAPAVLNSRISLLIEALVSTVKVNITIRSMNFGVQYDIQLFRGSLVPYLETNRFRPRLLAIQQTRPIVYRVKVLALLTTQTNPNLFWMLLTGNAEVAFSSSTANLPAVAASNAAAVTDAPLAAVNVATPAACLIRKARPRSLRGFIKSHA